MPRYLVERSFAEVWDARASDAATRSCSAVSHAHWHEGVTWLHSYLSADRQRSYCIVDGPSPEAVRRAAGASQLPVDRITEVRVLDPAHAL